VSHGRIIDELPDLGGAKPHALVIGHGIHLEDPAVEQGLAWPHGQPDRPWPLAVDGFAQIECREFRKTRWQRRLHGGAAADPKARNRPRR
jgi:hypothetical protein